MANDRKQKPNNVVVMEARMRVELMSEGFADPRRKPVTLAFPTGRLQRSQLLSGFRPAA